LEEKSPNRKWIQIVVIVVIVAAFALLAWAYFSQYREFSSENLDKFIRGFGPWAVVIYILIYAVSSPVPMLGTVLSATGGLLFGPIVGPFIVIPTATATSLVPFMLARQLGREWVEARLRGKRLEEIYQQSEGGKGFTFILLMRLVPVIPWEIQNYIAGLTKIALPTYLLATLLGILPLSTSLVLLGSAVRDPTSWQFFAAIGVTVVVALVPTVIVAVRNRKRKREEQS